MTAARLITDTVRASGRDPCSEKEWLALRIVSGATPETIYRGRRTSDGVLLVTGGRLREPTAIEADALTVLRTLTLDLAARRPDLWIDTDEAARLALPRLRDRIERQDLFTISEILLVP